MFIFVLFNPLNIALKLKFLFVTTKWHHISGFPRNLDPSQKTAPKEKLLLKGYLLAGFVFLVPGSVLDHNSLWIMESYIM
jgi:hypothetical protein